MGSKEEIIIVSGVSSIINSAPVNLSNVLMFLPSRPMILPLNSSEGRVKIEVVIAPDGHVKSTRVIGGHPLLVNPAVDAMKEWKFVPASEETTQIIEFEFKNANN